MLRLLAVLAITCTMCDGLDTGLETELETGPNESTKCRSDEELKWIYTCPGEDTCRDRDNWLSCLEDTQIAFPKCVCKEGLYRADDDSCITNEQCDKWKCPGDHEHFECDTECDNVCATLDTQNKTNCPIRKYVYIDDCSPHCYCDDGYARDDQNNCIPIEDCGLVSTTENSDQPTTY